MAGSRVSGRRVRPRIPPAGRRAPGRTVGTRSHSGSRRWSQHERQVAAARHVQEVLEVDQGEARGEARQGAPRDTLGADPSEQEAVSLLELGVIGRSAKENEYRLPIHPDHLARFEPDVAARLTLEHGYGATFGRSDTELAPLVAGLATREEIFERCDVVLLPKPQLEDVAAMRAGQILWGWPHCVQNAELTQLAIDQSLTLIAFEAMNHWTRDQTF